MRLESWDNSPYEVKRTADYTGWLVSKYTYVQSTQITEYNKYPALVIGKIWVQI